MSVNLARLGARILLGLLLGLGLPAFGGESVEVQIRGLTGEPLDNARASLTLEQRRQRPGLSAETIRQVLSGLCGRGATVLLTTHILEVAEKICQRVGIIHKGKLAFEADMSGLLCPVPSAGGQHDRHGSHLGANEATLEIGVDLPGSLGRAGS